MSRKLRFVPEGGALVEVTCRTIQSRFLLRPSSELKEIAVGVLARAQKLFPVEVCGVICLSNHLHLLLFVPDAERLARFVGYFNSKLAREIGRLYGWREKIWGRRYQSIVVSQEEAAQVDRLKYLLSNGCKEGLVERVRDWPGLNSADALLTGEPLKGYWFDRTREHAARRRGEDFDRLRYATPEELTLAPLPCWAHLSPQEYRSRIAALIEEIETEAKAERERNGTAAAGAAAVKARHPHDRPAHPKRSPAPSFHAFTRAARKELEEAYRWFFGAFREAAEKLRAGDRTVRFPLGSFPPALPFVGASA